MNMEQDDIEAYQPPSAPLESNNSDASTVQPLGVAVTSAFWGASTIAALAGIALLVISYPNYEPAGFAIFAMFWLLTVVVSIIVTIPYGLLVYAYASRSKISERFVYLMGGAAPGAILITYGSITEHKESISASLVVGIYGVIIAGFGIRTLNKAKAKLHQVK